ncbi:terminase small subunit protein [Pandoraea pnomenusa]|uniref:terminase small subunit-like protein n=1 Tax=Pandoraea pnomenusa TaxID=93220 RepID=UPI00119898AE|nr:terminase small subunit protein [Pandoraea pnomenusa]QDX22555.1 terminase small subunit protein [Pandoraea pnomenusa]
MTGRPSSFTQEIGDAICERLANGESLRSICRDEEMPSQPTVFRWIDSHEAFRKQYARAREAQAEFFADQIVSIADDGSNDSYVDDEGNQRTDHDVIARSRLRVDARKWIASKLLPKKYGDKVTNEHTGADGGPIVIQATPQDNDL